MDKKINELNKQREEINKQISKREWQSYVKKWKELSWFMKICYILVAIMVIIALYNLGGNIREFFQK
jgi:hypothetical protein